MDDTTKRFIGIDPGVKGGMAVLETLNNSPEVLFALSFEGITEQELTENISTWVRPRFNDIPVCVIEKVGYIKGDGPMGAFTFGKVYGLLRGLVLGNGVKIIDVYPMMWQSSLNCLSGGNKNVTKNKAIELFPEYHVQRPRGITHGIADALLIAEYGRRKFKV